MLGIDPDVGPVMPAAPAFDMRAAHHANPAFRPGGNPRGRGDQHEAQILAEARQRLVVSGRRDDIDLGLKR